jgi:glutamate carboxypeptidase
MDDALAQIASKKDPMLEKLLQLSTINSGTGNLAGLAQMLEELKLLITPMADEIEVIDPQTHERVDHEGIKHTENYGKVLSIKKRADAPIRVLLCGHMDTVFPLGHPFQSPRIIDNNTLQGPGVADMKGGLLVMLAALEAFEGSNQSSDLGWQVIINADEETGSLGSSSILESAALEAHAGMIYEPALADGTLVRARKGSGNFTLVINGKSAHAGREFSKGRNAIVAMGKAMSALNALNNVNDSITVNIARVTGGSAFNVVPDKAVCQFNVRCKAAGEQTLLEKNLEEITAEINLLDGIHAELSGQFSRAPKLITSANQLLIDWAKECGESINLDMQFKDTGGCCDGNNLAAVGLPNIDTLGVRGANIHTDQEFMLVDSLTERAQLSYLLLKKLSIHGENLAGVSE